MGHPTTRIAKKYFWIELIFLLFICYLRPFISDLEYGYYEDGNIWTFTTKLEFRLVYGSFSLMLFSAYYWLFLKPLLFKKQIFYLILSGAAFTLIYILCNKYQHLLVNKLPFLSNRLRAEALMDYQKVKISFVINYIITNVLFTLVGFAYIIRSLQQDDEVKQFKEEHLISELKYLKAQLQPHFFFNTLNSIYALAMQRSEETGPMVARLSEMMRYIIYDSDSQQVTLNREIDFIGHYIEIEQIRRPANIAIEFDVQGKTEALNIEPLLLLPLIENAFKHGIEDELENGFVRVIMVVSEDELTLQVENSKPASGGQKAKGGVGLENIRKRLALLYPGRYELDVDNTEISYRATLTLKLS